jgi:hypothetical protein
MENQNEVSELEAKWIAQIAFYLGDTNLPKDKFLLQTWLANHECPRLFITSWIYLYWTVYKLDVPLTTFVQFARMKALGATNVDILSDAISRSKHPLLKLRYFFFLSVSPKKCISVQWWRINGGKDQSNRLSSGEYWPKRQRETWIVIRCSSTNFWKEES